MCWRKGLEMPYTKIVLGLVRPEGPGFTCDNTGLGSLLYYLGDDLNTGKERGRIEEDLTQLKAWTSLQLHIGQSRSDVWSLRG